MSYTITLQDTAALLAHQRRLKDQFRPALRRGFISGAMRAVGELQRATRQAPPANPNGTGEGGAFNTGAYMRSWKAAPLKDGARVFNDSPYAGVIEFGRRAGARAPPIEAIARWAQRKLGLSDTAARQAAFQIAKSIARRGLNARLVLTSLQPRLAKIVVEEVIGELDRAERSGGKS